MPIIVPQVVRCSINGTYLGRPAVNVMDMFCGDGDGVSNPRQTNIDVMLETFMNAWIEHMINGLSTEYQTQSITWVDLDSEFGATGTKTSTASHDFPRNGVEVGNPYGAQVAHLMTKVGTSARGQRNGRWFLPGLTESNVTGNMLTSGHLDDMNAFGSQFVEATTETGVLATTHYYPVIVHTKSDNIVDPPVVVVTGTSQIHDMVCSAQVASQRRRNRP